MIAGCYTLHLYCDAEGCTTPQPYDGQRGHGPHGEYHHESGAECRRRARRAGWTLRLRTGVSICPACTRAKREPAKAPSASASE